MTHSVRNLVRVITMLVATLSGGLPASAQASPPTATVRVVLENNAFPRATLLYQAGPSQVNIVTIGKDLYAEEWTISEQGWDTFTEEPVVLVAGQGCESIEPQTLRCTAGGAAGSSLVDARLGDQNDAASVATACGHLSQKSQHLCSTVVRGGDGDDRLESVHVTPPKSGQGVLYGGKGADHLYAGQIGAALVGGPGGDTLFGGPGDDDIRGNGGTDRALGRGGLDNLRGGRGSDTFYARDDRRDVVRGGSGTDRGRLDRGDDVRSVERRF